MKVEIKNRCKYSGPGVYVGRPSPLGNPFEIGRDGSRSEVIAKYEDWLREELKKDGPAKRMFDDLVETLNLFEEVVLVCWCAPLPCHAEIIRKLLEERI